jgi:hypothetical protein
LAKLQSRCCTLPPSPKKLKIKKKDVAPLLYHIKKAIMPVTQFAGDCSWPHLVMVMVAGFLHCEGSFPFVIKK